METCEVPRTAKPAVRATRFFAKVHDYSRAANVGNKDSGFSRPRTMASFLLTITYFCSNVYDISRR